MIYNKPSLILTKSEEAPSVAGAGSGEPRQRFALSARSLLVRRSATQRRRTPVRLGGNLRAGGALCFRRGLSDSVFDLPPWFIKKNILTNDLRLLQLSAISFLKSAINIYKSDRAKQLTEQSKPQFIFN